MWIRKKSPEFRLEIGEPVVVAQAEPGDQVWGHFQFPRLFYTESGAICTEWDYSSDTVEYDGIELSAVSEDGGCSWRKKQDCDRRRYFVLYTHGFDSDAESREEAKACCTPSYGICVFRSTDCGRTWEYVSQVLANKEMFDPASPCDGPCEPMMRRMPDGSVVMLMRTGSRHPSYIVRSTDRCRSWSKPQRFDDIGVLLQLLVLDCGVTLASYGRPVLKLRAASDPAGMHWEEPIQLELSHPEETNGWKKSCFYTSFLPLNDREALMAYSDFQYPNRDGIGVKSILVPKITVVPEPLQL